jgi:hypothetical protein
VCPSDDPLAKDHSAVATWVEDAVNTLGEERYYHDLDLKAIPSGEALLVGNPEQSKRYVMAAVAQVKHWDRLAAKIRDQASNEHERINQVWGRRRMAERVVSALMRRALPFDKVDLLTLLNWCGDSDNLTAYYAPIGHVTRALQRYALKNDLDSTLGDAMQQFVARLRSSHDKEARRLATAVEQLCPSGSSEPVTAPGTPIQPAAQPAPAGSANVLDQLKRTLRMLPNDLAPAVTMIAPDNFLLRNDSPLRLEHEMLSDLFNEVVGNPHYYQSHFDSFKAGRLLLALSPVAMGRAVLAAAERHVNALLSDSIDFSEPGVSQSRYAAPAAAATLVVRDFDVDRDGTFDLLLYLSVLPTHQRSTIENATAKVIATATREATNSPPSEGERFVLSLFRASLISGPPLGNPADEVTSLTKLINDGATFFLVPGEAWSDAVNEEVPRLEASVRAHWAELFRHALSATTARPSAKWLKTARQFIQEIGGDHVREAMLRWFPSVTLGRTIFRLGSYAGDTRGASDTMHEENATCLRGLLWCVPILPQRDDMVRCVTSVTLSAYKKVPGVGPRAVKVGNAAVYALSEIGSKEAVGQLAMLKVRVKFGTAQKEIEKAFDAAAAALGLPRDQIEELGVPSYGLEEVGRRCEHLDAYRAELLVTGSDATLTWSDAQGKTLKSVPAKVKSQHKEDLKELQQSLKDIQSMLPAQRDRIDGMFLLQKSWPLAEWRERYYDHPLVGTIARRLLWCVDGTAAIFSNGTPADVSGAAFAHGKTAEVTPWHPVGRSIDEITAWRRRLEEMAITQPFKQAYREVYLLTDAERNTRAYSNRFAAHIIRQHQFNALCAARGWKNKLRLMVDASYPPATKELSSWGLRAEFWIEGIGQDYGVDTNESGTYLRLATDQVRFYRTQAAENWAHAGGGGYGSNAAGPGQANINEPVPLDEVPALVFSEIMRDVDLFVGVASIGNDPTWQDGGPQGRYRDYWQSYSFGELSGTAATRKEALERLVPRLKIAKRCSFTDRFLVVRGEKRVYKIHLGSGNILMEPNDQYLCIVPDARARATHDDVYLPFEGDSTLSIILSKALMLAEDTKIKDATIIRQIGGV